MRNTVWTGCSSSHICDYSQPAVRHFGNEEKRTGGLCFSGGSGQKLRDVTFLNFRPKKRRLILYDWYFQAAEIEFQKIFQHCLWFLSTFTFQLRICFANKLASNKGVDASKTLIRFGSLRKQITNCPRIDRCGRSPSSFALFWRPSWRERETFVWACLTGLIGLQSINTSWFAGARPVARYTAKF